MSARAQPRLAPPGQRGGVPSRHWPARPPGGPLSPAPRSVRSSRSNRPLLRRPGAAARAPSGAIVGVGLHARPPPRRRGRGPRRSGGRRRRRAYSAGSRRRLAAHRRSPAPPVGAGRRDADAPLALGLVGCGRLAEPGYLPALAAVPERAPRRRRRPRPGPPDGIAAGVAARRRRSGLHPCRRHVAPRRRRPRRAGPGHARPLPTSPTPPRPPRPGCRCWWRSRPPSTPPAPPARRAPTRRRGSGFNRRFDPGIAALQRGRPRIGPARPPPAHLLPPPQLAGPRGATTTRSLDLGPHLVDWARWLTRRRGRLDVHDARIGHRAAPRSELGARPGRRRRRGGHRPPPPRAGRGAATTAVRALARAPGRRARPGRARDGSRPGPHRRSWPRSPASSSAGRRGAGRARHRPGPVSAPRPTGSPSWRSIEAVRASAAAEAAAPSPSLEPAAR